MYTVYVLLISAFKKAIGESKIIFQGLKLKKILQIKVQ